MKKNLIYKILIGVCGALSVAAAVFLYFAETVNYDLSIQHFEKGSPFAIGASLLIGASVILGLAAAFLKRKDAPDALTKTSSLGMFASTVTAFMMFASFILSIRRLAEGIPVLELVQLILMVLSAAFFFLVFAGEKAKGGGFALLSLCPMLYAFVSLLLVYFDTAYGMNSPLKAYSLLLYISMALFWCGEARVALGRTHLFSYTFFGVLCLTFTATLGLSGAAIALYDTVGHSFSVITAAISIAIALFAFARLWSLATAEETTDEMKEEDGRDESDGE